jgi:hypothetical protein
MVRFSTDRALRREWTETKVEALYELGFLRIFVAWETLLEVSFYRYLCGYKSRFGMATTTGPYCRDIAAAEAAVLGGRRYRPWCDTATILTRCKTFIATGRHELVIARNSARLEQIAMIRHRIAHHQEDARSRFDAATMAIAHRRYPRSRPGKFLRDHNRSALPAVRWINQIVGDLTTYASQIV